MRILRAGVVDDLRRRPAGNADGGGLGGNPALETRHTACGGGVNPHDAAQRQRDADAHVIATLRQQLTAQRADGLATDAHQHDLQRAQQQLAAAQEQQQLQFLHDQQVRYYNSSVMKQLVLHFRYD